MTHRIEIRYCAECRWLMRSAWMAQELLSTFESDLASVALCPTTGGLFEVWVDQTRIWSRKESGRFPEIAELKRAVRDAAAPGKDLGHIDREKNGRPSRLTPF